MSTELFLYSKHDCHLCDEFKESVAPFLTGKNIVLSVIDIDNDLELKQRYGARVPVLVFGNTEICELKPDFEAIQTFLALHTD